MQFTMQVKMTNSEMRSPEDLAPMLTEAAEMIQNYRARGNLLDVNGNTVGQFEIVGDDERELDKALVSREELEELQQFLNDGGTVSAKAVVRKLIEGIQS